MTQQQTIMDKIKEITKRDVPPNYHVGSYRTSDPKKLIGVNPVAFLFQATDEGEGDLELSSRLLNRVLSVRLYLYTTDTKDPENFIFNLIVNNRNKLMDDLSLGGNALCIDIKNIDYGDHLDNFDFKTPGFNNNLSLVHVDYDVAFNDLR